MLRKKPIGKTLSFKNEKKKNEKSPNRNQLSIQTKFSDFNIFKALMHYVVILQFDVK